MSSLLIYLARKTGTQEVKLTHPRKNRTSGGIIFKSYFEEYREGIFRILKVSVLYLVGLITLMY